MAIPLFLSVVILVVIIVIVAAAAAAVVAAVSRSADRMSGIGVCHHSRTRERERYVSDIVARDEIHTL